MWICTCGTCGHAMTSLRRLLSMLSGSGCEHLTFASRLAKCFLQFTGLRPVRLGSALVNAPVCFRLKLQSSCTLRPYTCMSVCPLQYSASPVCDIAM